MAIPFSMKFQWNLSIFESTIKFIHDSDRFIRYVWTFMRQCFCHVLAISFEFFHLFGRVFAWNLSISDKNITN